ncbi:MAG: hypothetical protein PHC88_10685 [Terrimicrobiaceae bacterium]|nr:hypothetical protein [Terrimicrobiaceae bacterium]
MKRIHWIHFAALLAAVTGISPLAAAPAEQISTPPSTTEKQGGPGKTFAPMDELKAPFETPPNQFVIIPGKDPTGWSFMVEPYLWALGIDGDVGVKGFPSVLADYNARTILQNLKWGVMAKGEARYGKWGLLADGLFAELSATTGTPGPLYKSATATLDQGLAQLALAYRVWEDRRGFVDLYVGARYNYFSLSISADQDPGGIQQIGDDASQRISERLDMATQAAVSRHVAAFARQLDQSLQSLSASDRAKIAGLQQQIASDLRAGEAGAIQRLDALQDQLAARLKAGVDAGLEQVDALKSQVGKQVREGVTTAVVERWVDVPKEIRRLEDRSALRKAFNPVHRDFVSLVTAQVRQQLGAARVQLRQQLDDQLIAAARRRVASAEKVLAQAVENKVAAGKAAARRLVASARGDLSAAQARRAGDSGNAKAGELAAAVSKAQKRLAKSIANKLEDTLPAGGEGNRWWVDPIVGVRAQVDLTRWLFLATQCDAGGFYAGSRIAWNLNATIGVNFTRNLFGELGYRYFYMDYANGGFLYKAAESGVFVGGGVKF